MSRTEDRCSHFETFFSKHKGYILTILHQIVQSQRFEHVSTVLKGALKNMIEWIDTNIHTYLIKYIIDPQEHTAKDAQKAKMS